MCTEYVRPPSLTGRSSSRVCRQLDIDFGRDPETYICLKPRRQKSSCRIFTECHGPLKSSLWLELWDEALPARLWGRQTTRTHVSQRAEKQGAQTCHLALRYSVAGATLPLPR
ncbi:hypothetical protein CLAIMM_01980, partial [Cladophialophora immunda]